MWLAARSRRFWIIVGVLLPVLYVGSFGISHWIPWGGYPEWAGKCHRFIYAPIYWAAGTSDTAMAIYSWYVRLWVTPGPQPAADAPPL